MKQLVVSSLVFVLVTCGWSLKSRGEQVPAPQGELRVVDTDPGNWAWIAWNVFDHLIELTRDGTLVPGLAVAWNWANDRTLVMSLRQGIRFHNGEIFDAEIVKLNWDEYVRQKQPHLIGTFMNFMPEARLEVLDRWTVRFVFPEPDGAALFKFSNMHIGNQQFYREVGWGEKHW
jgi:peptide/nickel transport system substrate-binding protein